MEQEISTGMAVAAGCGPSGRPDSCSVILPSLKFGRLLQATGDRRKAKPKRREKRFEEDDVVFLYA